MAPPAKSKWDDDEESTPPSSPPAPAVARRSKFQDEEDDDSDVPSDWEGAEDSEEEAAKAKEAAAAKAKADAQAAASKKSKTQRIAEREAEKKRLKDEESSDEDSSEDEADKRARLRKTEQASDLAHAEDLFGDIGVPAGRSNAKAVVSKVNGSGAAVGDETIDLAALPLFNPSSKEQFTRLRETLAPLIGAANKKGPYASFVQELAKQLCKELPSEQIKKVASGLTTLSNERMKEEKAADKSGKKSKAQKTKSSLAVGRNVARDTTAYDDGGDFGDDDFM